MVDKGRITWLFAQFLCVFCIIILLCADNVCCKKKKDESPDEKWKKKDITDYTDADLERLYDQWEEGDDEPLPEDELPEWKRPQPKIDLSQIDPNDPEGMLKMTKKGKTVMLFATVAGNPEEAETEKISTIWQSSLHNANIDVQRYVVGANRVLFVVRDGSLAFPVRDFLITQENCELVTIEGKDYYNEKKNKDTNSPKKSGNTKEEKKKAGKTKAEKKIAGADKKKKMEEKKIKQNIENEIKKNMNDRTEL